MQKLLLVFGAIVICLFTGCMSPQQLRERNIAKNYQLFQSFS